MIIILIIIWALTVLCASTVMSITNFIYVQKKKKKTKNVVEAVRPVE